ncbi:hypothetical protein WICMUC_005205 [Wickerhamomyces mucosus]|uniref:Signal peptidase subunit 3 n=1 Tax=Wickerhamomyces mucosus TaxID=1378264 RepID=A0A9P8T757_9ASCO|nr:hypothetical protein WICMUC_005205 [Wickerhamomyces mucosus]
MFSIYQRGQYIVNFSLTLVGLISLFIVASSWAQLYTNNVFSIDSSISNVTPTANIKFSRRFGSSGGKPKENTKLIFDLDTDLTPLWNWNTKQVFIYLTVEYPGKKPESSNKVVYWDKIITDKNGANLTLSNELSKYSVWDVEESFRNREATVKLEWNIQPYVGPLVYGATLGKSEFIFPDVVQNSKKTKEKTKNSRNKNY